MDGHEWSAASGDGGVDERRRQATLLHPFVNGVRELGCARLSSSVRRGMAVRAQQATVRHQQTLGDGGSSSLAALGLRWRCSVCHGSETEGERRKKERERDLTEENSKFLN